MNASFSWTSAIRRKFTFFFGGGGLPLVLLLIQYTILKEIYLSMTITGGSLAPPPAFSCRLLSARFHSLNTNPSIISLNNKLATDKVSIVHLGSGFSIVCSLGKMITFLPGQNFDGKDYILLPGNLFNFERYVLVRKATDFEQNI